MDMLSANSATWSTNRDWWDFFHSYKYVWIFEYSYRNGSGYPMSDCGCYCKSNISVCQIEAFLYPWQCDIVWITVVEETELVKSGCSKGFPSPNSSRAAVGLRGLIIFFLLRLQTLAEPLWRILSQSFHLSVCGSGSKWTQIYSQCPAQLIKVEH